MVRVQVQPKRPYTRMTLDSSARHTRPQNDIAHIYAVSTREAGRDPDGIGIEASVAIDNRSPDDWVKDVEARKELGVTHVLVNTMNAGLSSPDAHIDAIRRFKEAVARI